MTAKAAARAQGLPSIMQLHDQKLLFVNLALTEFGKK